MNVLKADFFRFLKDKTTYILLGIVFLMSPLTCVMYSLMGNSSFTVERLIYQGLGTEILCVLIGLHLSMFIGKEYANNTIRNKLCYGEKRYKIAGCFFLESIIIALLYVLVSVASSLLFGAIFGNFEFASGFMMKLLCQTAIIVAFSLPITGVVISAKNMKAGFMVTVLISVIFTAISYALPMLATSFPVIEVVCRCLYMIVSTMLISSVNGVYYVGTFAFENIYANALILSAVYSAVSVGVTMLAVKKQSYK
ncbi:MAG: ABC transporter permease [Clostridia bacterium]|nr:ABC transporter permease [Clostridia bacterium]